MICGILFGYVLENAGFGSPCKLSGQFRLSDWSVLKVMLTAIVVAATGLFALREAGLLAADAVFVPPALLVASAVGGVLVGIGFSVGAYCPGTSIVGFLSGRLDALVFIVGVLIGTFMFAGSYGPLMESLMAAGELASGDTFTEVFGISELLLLAIMGLTLVAVFYFGSWFERRASGPVTAEQALAGAGVVSDH